MGVIIIAVFWLLGLLMAWSMCVVAARADHRQNMIRHARTNADTSRPDTRHVECGDASPSRQGPSSSVSITLLLMNCFWMKTPN